MLIPVNSDTCLTVFISPPFLFIVNRYATRESRCFFYFITNSIKPPLFLQMRNDADNVSTTYAISHYIFEIFTPFSFNLYSNFTPFKKTVTIFCGILRYLFFEEKCLQTLIFCEPFNISKHFILL